MLLISISVSSQKLISPPNIVSPFKTKQATPQGVIIKPQYSDTIKKLQIENVKGSFYVDLSKEKRTAESISKILTLGLI